MKLSAALDTSASRTAICVVNSRDGSVVFEVSVATDPAIIFGALAPFLPRLDRVGQKVGSVAPWLHRELTALGLPMDAVEKIAMREPTGERKAHVSGAVIPLRRNNS
jgi:transposase